MENYLFNNIHNNRNDILETYRLKTQKTAPPVKELKAIWEQLLPIT